MFQNHTAHYNYKMGFDILLSNFIIFVYKMDKQLFIPLYKLSKVDVGNTQHFCVWEREWHCKSMIFSTYKTPNSIADYS